MLSIAMCSLFAVASFGQIAPEPSNHPTNFQAMTVSPAQIDLSWTESTGPNLPTGYVIHANTTDVFTDPVDGIEPSIDADLSGGSAVVTVAHGAGAVYSFASLTPLTTYHFRIVAYSNDGSDIDYLTTGSFPSATAMTLEDPNRSKQPTALTAIRSGSSQINLSWTKRDGTNLPTGYVVYANKTGTFDSPTDGMLPIIDTDLSDGEAVVTIVPGNDSDISFRYRFSSLEASTIYHFQLWAYNGAGSNIEYITSPAGPTASVTTRTSQISGKAVILEEGFEDDGHLSRYTASSEGGFNEGASDHFARTDGSNISNISGAYTGFSGNWFWAAEDTDDDGGSGMKEQTITFDPVDIAGYTDLSVSGLFGAGNDLTLVHLGYDRNDYIRLSYQIDLGMKADVLCFRSEGRTNTPIGLDANCDGTTDNANGTDRLVPELVAYSADITGTGESLTVEIKVYVDASLEEIAFDDIIVAGVSPTGTQEIMGNAGWRLLSLPKTGGTVADIADDTAVQGVPGGANVDVASNFIIYDDTGIWESPVDVSTPWGDGYGFALYFYNNTDAGSTELPLTLDATGDDPSTDVRVNLNTTVIPPPASSSYFTLAGNPFNSDFDASKITSEGSGIQNNVHFWDNGTGSYSTEERTMPYIVSPWQGFWVEVFSGNANSTTAITFPASGKTDVGATGTFFSKEATNRGDIAFALSSQTTYDEALRLSFRETATRGHDVDDASKLRPLLSEYATMAFNSNGVLKSVESLPWELTEEITVPMEEDLVGVSGSFTLAWKGLESVPADWGLTFHDYDTGINSDMRSVSEYTFDVASLAKAQVNPLSILAGPAAAVQKSKTGDTRFAVTVTPNVASIDTEGEDRASVFALEQNYPNPFNPSTVINYSVANSGKVSLSVYNLLGQRVAQLVNETKAAGSYNVTWNATAAASGMYYYRLEAGGQTLIRKMILIK